MSPNFRWQGKHSIVAAAYLAVSWLTFSAHAQPTPAPQEVPRNYAADPAPEQPIPYSHKVHLALGLTCDTCHTGGRSSAQVGFPPAAACMTCHAAVAADKPSIQTLAAHAASGEPIPWVRVYEVLPGVTWSHEPHLAAGVGCGACHGNVAELDAMSMTTGVTAMASCIGCHESRSASTECATCHAWPQSQPQAASR